MFNILETNLLFTEEKERKSNEQYITVSEKEKDVVEALKVLGYNIKEIEKIMKSLDINSSTEDMIKQALKILR